MADAVLSPLDKVRIKGYQTDEDLQEAIGDIQRAESEHNEALVPVRQRIERIEALQESFQKGGINRDVALRAIEETENPSLLDEGGLSVESFTTIPSDVNRVSLEELTENQKKVAYGALAALGIGLILKLVHSIWKWIRKRKANAPGDKAQEMYEDIRKKEEEIRDLKEEIHKSNLIREELEKFKQTYRDEAERNDAKRGIDHAWNRLLEVCFTQDSKVDPIRSVFLQMQKYDQAITECFNVTNSINSAFDRVAEMGEGAQWMRNMTKHAYATTPPQDMRKNLEEIREVIDECDNLRNQVIEWDEKTEEEVSRLIKDKKALMFLNTIREYTPFSKKAKLLNTENFDERAAKGLDSLREKAANKDLAKDMGDELKKYIDFYNQAMSNYFACLRLYTMIAGSYDRFMTLYDKEIGGFKNHVLKFAKSLGVSIARSFSNTADLGKDEIKRMISEIEAKLKEKKS